MGSIALCHAWCISNRQDLGRAIELKMSFCLLNCGGEVDVCASLAVYMAARPNGLRGRRTDFHAAVWPLRGEAYFRLGYELGFVDLIPFNSFFDSFATKVQLCSSRSMELTSYALIF